jgi:quinol monooxygenase YgiN
MKTVIVRYRVHPDRAAENEALIRAVYEELHTNRAEGLRYATFKLDDGVSFLHIAETEDGHNPLPGTQAFKAFQAEIEDRCEQPPVVSELTQIGAYRLFSAQE